MKTVQHHPDTSHRRIAISYIYSEHKGVDACRDLIDEAVIDDATKTFENGYALITQKASIGQARYRRGNRDLLHGFILLERLEYFQLKITLVCNSLNYRGDGDSLMSAAFSLAKNMNIQTVVLYSLPEPHLLNWYREHGFKVVDEILHYDSNDVKVYTMYAKL